MGEIAALSASALWATASLFYARLGREIGAWTLNFLKCALALAMMLLLWLIGWRWIGPMQGDLASFGWLSLSGVIGLTLGDTAFFLGLQRIGPRRTLLLASLTPAFTSLLVWWFLNEALYPRMFVGMLLTMAGVLWVISERNPLSSSSSQPPAEPSDKTTEPSDKTTEPLYKTTEPLYKTTEPLYETAEPPPSKSAAFFSLWSGVIWALLSAFCQATGHLFTKLAGVKTHALEMSIARLSLACALLGLGMLWFGRKDEIRRLWGDRKAQKTLLLAVFLGTFLGVWLSTASVRNSSHTGIAATLGSTSPIFILPLAFFVLREKVGWRAIVGAFVALLGIALLFLR